MFMLFDGFMFLSMFTICVHCLAKYCVTAK